MVIYENKMNSYGNKFSTGRIQSVERTNYFKGDINSLDSFSFHISKDEIEDLINKKFHGFEIVDERIKDKLSSSFMHVNISTRIIYLTHTDHFYYREVCLISDIPELKPL